MDFSQIIGQSKHLQELLVNFDQIKTLAGVSCQLWPN